MAQLDTQDRERDNPYKMGPGNLIYLYEYLAVARCPSWEGAVISHKLECLFDSDYILYSKRATADE